VLERLMLLKIFAKKTSPGIHNHKGDGNETGAAWPALLWAMLDQSIALIATLSLGIAPQRWNITLCGSATDETLIGQVCPSAALCLWFIDLRSL